MPARPIHEGEKGGVGTSSSPADRVAHCARGRRGRRPSTALLVHTKALEGGRPRPRPIESRTVLAGDEDVAPPLLCSCTRRRWSGDVLVPDQSSRALCPWATWTSPLHFMNWPWNAGLTRRDGGGSSRPWFPIVSQPGLIVCITALEPPRMAPAPPLPNALPARHWRGRNT